jgi:hypothetical protein
VSNDEKFNHYLAENKIVWQFNLSRAPWWGGQFERMFRLVKNALHKTIGRNSRKELEEVLLDVEVCLNYRPLSYVEDDLQFPVLTLNTLMFHQTNAIPEAQPHRCEEIDLSKRAKYLRSGNAKTRCGSDGRRNMYVDYEKDITLPIKSSSPSYRSEI